ncbi:MAG: VWA domain-containing protein [Devosia sp.]
MTDEALASLKSLNATQPSPEAKKLALNAAMVAFDKAQATSRKTVADEAGFFTRLGGRLRNGWIAAPAGAAAIALLLLPVGYQALNSTSMTSLEGPPMTLQPGDDKNEKKEDETRQAVTASTDAAKPLEQIAVQPVSPPRTEVEPGRATDANAAATVDEPIEDELKNRAVTTVQVRPDGTIVGGVDAFARLDDSVAQEQSVAQGVVSLDAPAPEPTVAASAPSLSKMRSAGEGDLSFAVDSGMALQSSDDEFAAFDENRLQIVKDEPVSTFSIDVDTASYSFVRSMLEDGYIPEPNAVRLEELINYFPYDYAGPQSLDAPFRATMAVIPTPWNDKTELLEIGIKGYVPPAEDRQPQNLTFLIDTSGSMDEPNKLPLLKRSFGLLVDQLKAEDTVSIVVYAGSAGIVLEPTKASEKTKILKALDNLSAGGSTAGAEGIALAYSLAEESKVDGGVNRVILATDGDFNVGISDPEELKAYIKEKRESGVFLSVLGFGRGNLDDALMQALAQNGNGNASYIDNFREARKVLVEEGGANLVTIAKDVKIQVEFNPAVVSEYRLIGYETRALNREDFNNDAVDAGEIGAGHTVTALYEITLKGSGGELNEPLRYGDAASYEIAADDEIGFLKMRYKAPDGDVSKLIETPIGKNLMVDEAAKAGDDQRFAAAVAAFGQKLKGSNYGAAMSWDEIAALASGAKGADADGYRAEFVQLVDTAALLDPDRPGKATE